MSTFPSRRFQILQKLEQNLKAINGAPDFNFDLTNKTVSRDIKHVNTMGVDDFPALFINANIEDLAHKFFQKTENDLRPIVVGHVKKPDNNPGTLLADEIEKLIHDVKVAVYKDIQFLDSGGQPLAVTTLVGPQIRITQSEDDVLSTVTIDLVILYRNPRQTP